MPIYAADTGRSGVAIFNARSEAEAAATCVEQWFQGILRKFLHDGSHSGRDPARPPAIRIASDSEMSRWWVHQRQPGEHHLGHGGDVVVVILRRRGA